MPAENLGAVENVFLVLTNVTPGATEPILTNADVTAFEKTSSDTLKVFAGV